MNASAVVVRDLARSFGTRVALAGVDLSLGLGITAILGPNGAGKTTLVRTLATISPPDRGEVWVDGMSTAREPDRREIRRRLGYLPQELTFPGRSRVFDVVDYLLVLRGHREDRSRRRAVHQALVTVGLADRAGERVGQLSGGMRRRLALAQAIAGRPGLVLLDEPTVGLDPDQRLAFRSIVSELAATATVVVSTHEIDDVAATAGHIVVLDGGRVLAEGSPLALTARARGRAWTGDHPAAAARACWRLPDGRYRGVGDPPPDATLVEPTLEDAYLLLVGPRRGEGWRGQVAVP